MFNYSAVQRGLFWATSYRTFGRRKQAFILRKIRLPPLDQRRHDANYVFG